MSAALIPGVPLTSARAAFWTEVYLRAFSADPSTASAKTKADEALKAFDEKFTTKEKQG